MCNFRGIRTDTTVLFAYINLIKKKVSGFDHFMKLKGIIFDRLTISFHPNYSVMIRV